MTRYLVHRFVITLFVVWGVLTLSFILTMLAPGDIAESLVGQRVDPDLLETVRARLGVNQSPVHQYFFYLGNISQGDWGNSLRYQEPVWELIRKRVPRTATLAFAALLFAVPLGVFLGAMAGIWQGRLPDSLISTLGLIGISAPVFWIGLLLVWFFSLFLGWLPPSGFQEGDYRYLILPAMGLGLRSMALISRISRAAFVELQHASFVRTAKAKGVSAWSLYGKHLLKNASLPIVTVIGLDLGNYLSGAVLTEKVFGWPGVGRLMVDAILARDLALVNACVVFSALVYITANLIVDLCYGILDPRIREQRS